MKRSILLFLLCSSLAAGQKILNHPFPRIMWYNFGLGNDTSFINQFQYVSTVIAESTFLRKHPPPNSMYVTWHDDFTNGLRFGDQFPDSLPPEWRVRDEEGNYLHVHGGNWYIADVSRFCPRITRKIFPNFAVRDELFREAAARFMAARTPWDVFDGIASSNTQQFPPGTRRRDRSTHIDLDRNGINDFTEHGPTWILNEWRTGQNEFFRLIRQACAPYLGNNSDSVIITWHNSTDTIAAPYVNGIAFEEPMIDNPPHTWQFTKAVIDKWNAGKRRLPELSYVFCALIDDSANAPHKPYLKNDYQLMRWMLGWTTVFTDWYFNCTDHGDWHWVNVYDEYLVKLGHAATGAQQIGSTDVWVRFFDNGCVIVNMSAAARTVRIADLTSLRGYTGPYYRFHGNQDPVWNNGERFESVTLRTRKQPGEEQPIGDAIMLVRSPQTAVADIIMDNAYHGCSPNVYPPVFTGPWQVPGSMFSQRTNPAWYVTNYYERNDPRLWVYNKQEYWRAQYVKPGNQSGRASVTYTAPVNVGGVYRLLEWHGYLGASASQYSEATAVPVTVKENYTTVYTGTINQRAGYGRWNTIDTLTLTAGDTARITLTNDGTDGYTIADAFKLVYVPSDSQKK